MKPALVIVAWLAGLAALAVAGAALVIYSGVYNIAATRQHIAPVYWLLETVMRRSVIRHSQHIEVPPLSEPAAIERGLRLYHSNCLPCHGAPGIAPDGFALGMLPEPANLALTARQWRPAELYWVVKHGVKTSGMPAWEFRMSDSEMWAIVAFVATLPRLSPGQYRERAPAVAALPAALPAALSEAFPAADAVLALSGVDRGDLQRGKLALQQYACVSCHVIPGVVGANKPVGPSLVGIGSRKYLAGAVPNTADNMIRWLRFPQQVAPGSAMPNLGVAPRDARDMAMFLETLK